MQVELQNSKQDYIDFYKSYLKGLFQKRIVAITIISFFVISAICGNHLTWLNCILTIIGYGVFIALLTYYIPLVIAILKLNKKLKNGNSLIANTKLIISDEGLISEREDVQTNRRWETIKLVEANKKFIFLKLIDKKVIIIPKRFFANEIEAINFLGLLQSQNKSKTPYFINEINSQNKPNYKLGWLCIIPLIGAFAGAIFILQGIFKYNKDKWLIIIGLGGIVFTIAVYGSLYLFSESNLGKQGFVPIAQMEMNSLVKEIEFYKIQHGTYPDSLKQIDTKNEFINITDPLGNNLHPHIFNYHRIGNKYTLFSSGVDEIPNTADDIYPSLKIDTNKLGLVIDKK